MNTFKLVISSPDGNRFDGEATGLYLRGSEGDLAILAGHIPFITPVVPCDCKVTTEDETEKIGHTDGGILTVSEDKVTLLSGSFVWNE
ncbi:MAG: F0F1 ATP synthase subunit epsilon [Oscillospiraceae bacterium]|nr:F0F1 ATP synthase subunit epsilon [Oscillospiraceae bacterium]MCH5190014.1 F0F1 ATP synthase subunit epsilon [Oscillospiraceae bacterium]